MVNKLLFEDGICQYQLETVNDGDRIEINNNINSSYYRISCNDGYTNQELQSPSITFALIIILILLENIYLLKLVTI